MTDDKGALPHNEEAEQSFLGAALLNNDVLDDAEFLRAEHFYFPTHGRLFEAMREIVSGGGTADPITLRPLLDDDAGLKEMGGVAYAARLAASVSSVKRALDYAREIHAAFLRRRLIEVAEDVDYTARHGALSPDRQIERAEAELFEIASKRSTGDVVHILDAYDSMTERAVATAQGEIDLIDTGFRDLDKLVGGMLAGDLFVIGGRPSMGKTAAALAIARHNYEAGRTVGMIQLEMKKEQIAARIVSRKTSLPVKRIMHGQLTSDEWDAVVLARRDVAESRFFVDDRYGVDLDSVVSRARAMRRIHGIDVLFIDYLGRIAMRDTTEYERVTQVSAKLKELALMLDIPVIACHQLNRANESRDDKRPTLADLRGSGAIEQDADGVVFVHREEYYVNRERVDDTDEAKYNDWLERKNRCRGVAELIVAKQRNGETGIASTRFHALTASYGDRLPDDET